MYENLTIKFFDGQPVEFHKDEWDDYAYNGEFIIVKKKHAWIAMYNKDNVVSVEVS